MVTNPKEFKDNKTFYIIDNFLYAFHNENDENPERLKLTPFNEKEIIEFCTNIQRQNYLESQNTNLMGKIFLIKMVLL